MKLKLLFILIFLAGLVCIAPVAASKYQSLTELQLVQKNPSTWVQYGIGYGFEPTYEKDNIIFDGPAGSYTLISYAEPWGSKNNILANTDSNGNINMRYSYLRQNLICNSYSTGEYAGKTGAKLWLVPTTDLTDGILNKWNPSAWYFETKLLPCGS
jgi:hypothetical protein